MTDPLLSRALEFDATDPLAGFRERFVIADPDLIYLDGNSLGRLPIATRDRLRTVVEQEWGAGLIRGWARWIDLAREAGDVLATGVLGVSPGEVTLADSTTVNLYKLASAALDARPGRRVIVTDDDNFPTDRYVLEGLAAARGLDLRVASVDPDAGVTAADLPLDREVALVCLSHVAYRSGARADLVGITAAAHAVGALVLWDLCHSAGSVPTPLRAAGADLAVGCTYKYLNAGPGAPAFLYVRADLHAELRQPIWGWFGQREQFAMGQAYDPVPGIERFTVGTPPVLGGYAVLEGARLTAEAGIDAIAAKGAALTAYALDLIDAWLPAPTGPGAARPDADGADAGGADADGAGWRVATPRDAARRGAHLTLHHPAAWQVTQALHDAGVIPDFRTPDRLRLGFAPLYTRFADVHHALTKLRTIVQNGAHLAYPETRSRVT
jgi:kynureninase